MEERRCRDLHLKLSTERGEQKGEFPHTKQVREDPVIQRERIAPEDLRNESF